MGDDMGQIAITAFSEMNLVADPLHLALHSKAGLHVVWGDNPFRRERQVIAVAPVTNARSMVIRVLLLPHLPQGPNCLQVAQLSWTGRLFPF